MSDSDGNERAAGVVLVDVGSEQEEQLRNLFCEHIAQCLVACFD